MRTKEAAVAETAQEIDLGLAGLERREGNIPGAQDAADDLSEAAEAGDDDFGMQLGRRVERPVIGLRSLAQCVVQHQEQWA